MAVLKIYQSSNWLPITPKWGRLQREGLLRYLSLEIRIYWRSAALLLRKIGINQVAFFPVCVFFLVPGPALQYRYLDRNTSLTSRL